MSNVSIVTDKNFNEEVLDSDKPVLVNFTATWSQECQNLANTAKNLAASREDIKVTKIDVGGIDNTLAHNDNPKTRELYNIQAFPTTLLFKNGKVAGMMLGQTDEQDLNKWVDAIKDEPEEKTIAIEDFYDYAENYYKQLHKAAKEHAELTSKVMLQMERGLFLTASFTKAAAGIMLVGLLPTNATFVLGSIITIPNVMNFLDGIYNKLEVPKENEFESGVLRMGFNIMSLAGGGWLSMIAVSGYGLASITGAAGLALGLYVALTAFNKIGRDWSAAFTTDISKHPVEPPERDETALKSDEPAPKP